MSFLDSLKKKIHLDDDDDESSFTDKFKQFGHSDDDAALVQNVAKKAQQNVDDDDDDDDDDLTNAQNAHRKIYDHNDDDDDDATLGKAAAFEALKKYSSGKKDEKDKKELQKHFVAMAMSEGLEIWKKKNSGKGEVAAGKKEKVMEQAAKSAIKMLAKSEKK